MKNKKNDILNFKSEYIDKILAESCHQNSTFIKKLAADLHISQDDLLKIVEYLKNENWITISESIVENNPVINITKDGRKILNKGYEHYIKEQKQIEKDNKLDRRYKKIAIWAFVIAVLSLFVASFTAYQQYINNNS